MTAALRHPEAAGPDHGLPACSAPWICSPGLEGISFYGPRLSGRPSFHTVGFFLFVFVFCTFLLLYKIQVLEKRKKSGVAFFLKKPFSFSCFLCPGLLE